MSRKNSLLTLKVKQVSCSDRWRSSGNTHLPTTYNSIFSIFFFLLPFYLSWKQISRVQSVVKEWQVLLLQAAVDFVKTSSFEKCANTVLCSGAVESLFDSLRQTHIFPLWTPPNPPPPEWLCHYLVDMYQEGDGCSHSSWQYQRWGWYGTFNTALIAPQSHSKAKQLRSECTTANLGTRDQQICPFEQ